MPQGYAAQLAFDRDADGLFDPASAQLMEFVEEITLGERTELIDAAGTRGTRSAPAERVAAGLKHAGGRVTLVPSPAELDVLLPFLLGGSEADDVFAPADALPAFQIMIDRGSRVHRYAGCHVDRAVFRSRKGQPLKLTLELRAVSEIETAAGAFPPGLTYDAGAGYVFHQGTLELFGASRAFREFELILDNRLIVEHNNSQTATLIEPGERIVLLNVDVPYDAAHADLHSVSSAGPAGGTGTLTFTNGERSLEIAFPHLIAVPRTPAVPARGELRLPLQFRAYQTGATAELTLINHAA